MNRQALSEQLRRIRVAEDRSPLDAAFAALCSLTHLERQLLCARFNSVFERATPPQSLTYKIEEPK